MPEFYNVQTSKRPLPNSIETGIFNPKLAALKFRVGSLLLVSVSLPQPARTELVLAKPSFPFPMRLSLEYHRLGERQFPAQPQEGEGIA